MLRLPVALQAVNFIPQNLIDISVDEPFQEDLPVPWLQSVVEAALVVVLLEGQTCQVSLLVTNDAKVSELNRHYRGLDEVTDVLSFSAIHSGHWAGDPQQPEEDHENVEEADSSPFVYPPDEPVPLGEVVISYPQSQRQALDRGEPADRELALLIVHGVLHLAGHDHLGPQEESQMKAKERAAMDTIPEVAIPHVGTLNT